MFMRRHLHLPWRWQTALLALRIPNFRLYWTGQAFSTTGRWMQTAANGWLVTELTDSPAVVGTVITVQFLPILLLALVAGAVIDRVDKRRFLMAMELSAMAQALTVGLLVVTGTIQLWHLYLLAAALGTINAFAQPARQTFISELVGRELVPNAVGLYTMAFNTARLVGPALAGAVIAGAGVGAAFLVQGGLVVPAVMALASLRREELHYAPQGSGGAIWREVAEGLQYILATPSVLQPILMMAFIGTFGYNFTVALPLLARQSLHVGSVQFGFMSSAIGAGSILGALLLAAGGRATETRLLVGAWAFSALLVALGLSPWYPLSLVVLVLLGLAGITFTATGNARLQVLSPDHLRGRVLSVWFLLFAGSTPIGSALLGAVASMTSISAAVALFGLLCGVGAALGLAYRLRPFPIMGTAPPLETAGDGPESLGRPPSL
jgi:MFS family permease